MKETSTRCLILACGNTLRGDDGVGPWLAEWAENRFHSIAAVQVISYLQWTPELAEDVAHAEYVLFIDCAIDTHPGSVKLTDVSPSTDKNKLSSHHQSAAELLALGHELYNSLPRQAQILTIGAAATALGEVLSKEVTAALPFACSLIEKSVLSFTRLANEKQELATTYCLLS